jgi:membrane-bound serine protease (ClpP class)
VRGRPGLDALVKWKTVPADAPDRRIQPLFLGALALLCVMASAAGGDAQAARPFVYVVPIEGMIDLGVAPFVRRVLAEASDAHASAVVLEINTFGGQVDAAVIIRDALLEAQIPTVAFINKRAISAGALISLAAHTIAMADGGTIGAATPVQVGAPGGGAQPVDEKTVSYMRKEFRATAESRKRPPLLAEAMVDPDVIVPGVIDKGKLLTLTTAEALSHKIADSRADTVEAVLASLNLTNADIRRPGMNWAEQIVRFLTHPILSSVLMTIGILGIIVELRTPGFGVPGALGIGSLAAFFWGHWLVRLAGWEELLLIGIGTALLALEVFVIPGFGVAGVLGLLAILGGLTLTLVGAGATVPLVVRAAVQVAVSLLLALVGAVVLFRFLPRLPFGRQLVLDIRLGSVAGYASAPESDRRWVGKSGTTVTPLRPAGIADFEGERVDVVSQGDYVEGGAPIEVVHVDGNRIVVRRRAERLGKE